ncbi:uncharacterized protein VDAG_02374 [Verticillium dahliae VdLs.17]|uniref:Uncharacterized protein n=1 Tax=Verticillium dahliae (strain VdLs.17 / ATCC MYA-4575 / FGSC 10137) TaxID=498257 RepID=G2WXP2_VERDV|nr:uncharacterized protein VDAG_02374 [Verticillium dahliae VdLs.17]EGY20850.1 hypothetical protein VDAG_02374 [Verticillium dahliae VdLs.17]
MFIISPTEESKELATQAHFPVDKFIRNIDAKDFWRFPDGMETIEAKRLLRHYVVKQKPTLDKRAASRGIHIEGRLMTVGPDVVWLRDDLLRNNLDKTTVICLAIPAPSQVQNAAPSHEGPKIKQTLMPEIRKGGTKAFTIDWSEKGFADATAAVKESKGTMLAPVHLQVGCVLQLDEHEELYVRPEAEGVCMVLFGHKYSTQEAGSR